MPIVPALWQTPVTRESPKKWIIMISNFDRFYWTNLQNYILIGNIAWAYDHLHQSGIYSNSIKIEWMVILYNFLHEQLQVSDALVIQKGITQKIWTIISEHLYKKQESSQRKVYETLHAVILEYYKDFIEQKHYQKLALPIPYWIIKLKEDIHASSPLGKDIQSITLPSCEWS